MNDKDKHVDLYNEAYTFVTPDFLSVDNKPNVLRYLTENSLSLVLFLKKYFEDIGGLAQLAGKDVLEVGCGLGGLAGELLRHNANVLGVDISELAIIGAKEINQHKGDFRVFDVCSDKSLNQKFDYIIDSHTLHCLITDSDRRSYFNFIKRHLKPSGIFMAETISFNSEIQEPLGFDLDSDYTLYKEVDQRRQALRKVLPSLELEKEIVDSGLKINTFFYHHELSINIFPEYPSYPVFRQPKVVRYSAKL